MENEGGRRELNGGPIEATDFHPNADGDWVVDGFDIPVFDAIDAAYFTRRWCDIRALAAIGVRTERDRHTIAAALNYQRYRGPIGWMWPLWEYPYRAHANPKGHVFRQRVADGKHRVMRPKRSEQGDDTMVPIVGPQTLLRKRWGDPEFVHVITEGEGKVAALDRAGFAVVGCGGVDTFHDPALRRAGRGFRLRPAWERLLRMAIDGDESAGIGGGVEDVVLLFDADIDTNAQVKLAAQRLAGSLRSETFGLRCALAKPPVVNGDTHSGVDDVAAFVDEQGEDAVAELQRIVAEAGHIQSVLPEDFAAKSGGQFHDDHVCRVFAAMLKRDHRFVIEQKRWLVWANTHWSLEVPGDNAALLPTYADLCNHYDQLAAQAAEGMGEKDGARVRRFADTLRQAHRREMFCRAVRDESMLRISASRLDAHSGFGLLNTPSGTIDLSTCTLREHRREDLLTAVTSVAYRPGATSELWSRHVESMWPDAGQRLSVQRACGYMMTASCSEQGFFCLLGPTGTGKSTFVAVILHCLGTHATMGETSMFLLNRGQTNGDLVSGGFGAMAAQLAGKRLIVLEEVPTTSARFDDQRLKLFTSGSDVLVRPPYSAAAWPIRVNAKILWLMNELPGGDSSDPSLGRRMRLLRADQTIDAPVLGLQDTLKAPEHAEAVLAWLIEGIALWRSFGLGKMPSAWEVSLADMRRESDPVAAWMSDELELEPPRHEGERVYARRAWDAFRRWLGVPPHMTRNRFARRLAGLGIERGQRVRVPGERSDRDWELTGCRWADGDAPNFAPEDF